MRIRIQLINFVADPFFNMMRMRIQVTKIMRIPAYPDPQDWQEGNDPYLDGVMWELPLLGCEGLPVAQLLLYSGLAHQAERLHWLLPRGRFSYNTRDKERSPVLQTPSNSFQHCSLPRVMWGVLWEVKRMSWTFMASYGRKLFLHLWKLEWFKSKQIWIDENVFCSQDLFRAVNSDRTAPPFSKLNVLYNTIPPLFMYHTGGVYYVLYMALLIS